MGVSRRDVLHWATVAGVLLAMTGPAAAQQGAGGGGEAGAIIYTVLISVLVTIVTVLGMAAMGVFVIILLLRSLL